MPKGAQHKIDLKDKARCPSRAIPCGCPIRVGYDTIGQVVAFAGVQRSRQGTGETARGGRSWRVVCGTARASILPSGAPAPKRGDNLPPVPSLYLRGPTMKTTHALLIPATLLIIGACDESPTAGRAVSSNAPVYEQTFGSDDVSGDEATTATAVTSTEATADSTDVPTGYTFGSGN